MPPKDSSKATGKTWSDATERQLLLDINKETNPSIPNAVFEKIAAKMGPPHTVGSLRTKIHRMKEAAAKASGIGKEKASDDDAGKTKRKAAASAESEGSSEVSKKGRKSKKAKANEDEAGVKSEPRSSAETV